jgi:hypothetical protein
VASGVTGTLVYGGEAFALVGLSLTGAQGVLTYLGLALLNWNVVTTNQDGTPCTDLAGYRIYHGTVSHIYDPPAVDAGNVLTYQWNGLTPGTHYFAVTAYDTSNNESENSAEVSKTY